MAGKSENRFLQILEEYLRQLTPPSTIKEVAKFLGINESSFKSYFATPGEQIQEAFPLHFIRQLYIGFNIPYHKFLLTEEEYEIYVKSQLQNRRKIREGKIYIDPKQILTRHSPKITAISDFTNLEYSSRMSRKQSQRFINKYTSQLTKYIAEAQDRFIVYESLGRLRETRLPFLKAYGQAHEKIFSFIESQLTGGGLKEYSRYLALPYVDHKQQQEADDFQACSEQLIEQCSLPLFKHICRCLVADKKRGKQLARFFVIPKPVRPYHFGLIDNKITLSEYSRYSSANGGLLPSLLFIESRSSLIDDNEECLYDIYQEDIDQIKKGKYEDWYFKDIEQFEDWANSAKKKIDERLESDRYSEQQREAQDMMPIKMKAMQEIFRT